MAHMDIAVAINCREKILVECDREIISGLCECIPDMFDYVDEDSIRRYSVKEIKSNKKLLTSVYGYFSSYQSFTKDLSDRSIDDGLLYGMDDDDLVYIVDCHE